MRSPGGSKKRNYNPVGDRAVSLIIRLSKSDLPKPPDLPGRDWLLLKIRQVDANLSRFGIASFNYPLDVCVQYGGVNYVFQVDRVGDVLTLLPVIESAEAV